ncbi:MAG: catechol 2,3-dioxygenase [Hyphomicrobiaceae bacterium]|jgi:catechol 2,3-dioxygenase
MQLRWSHAVIYVRDLDNMVAFYSDVLGFQTSDRGSVGEHAGKDLELVFLSQVGSEHHQLAFLPLRGEGPSTTLDHMAFRVDSLADVKEMARRLDTDGRASELAPVSHGNAWAVYFKDPEGNGVEVFCDSPFAVVQPQVTSWDLSMSEEELKAATQERFGAEPGFEPMPDFYKKHRQRFKD